MGTLVFVYWYGADIVRAKPTKKRDVVGTLVVKGYPVSCVDIRNIVAGMDLGVMALAVMSLRGTRQATPGCKLRLDLAHS